MYPYEVAEFLKQRGYCIGGDDLLRITSTKENPQLNHIKYNPGTSEYEMWDVEGNYYKFTAMPFTEANQKGLVKPRNNIKEDYER